MRNAIVVKNKNKKKVLYSLAISGRRGNSAIFCSGIFQSYSFGHFCLAPNACLGLSFSSFLFAYFSCFFFLVCFTSEYVTREPLDKEKTITREQRACLMCLHITTAVTRSAVLFASSQWRQLVPQPLRCIHTTDQIDPSHQPVGLRHRCRNAWREL